MMVWAFLRHNGIVCFVNENGVSAEDVAVVQCDGIGVAFGSEACFQLGLSYGEPAVINGFCKLVFRFCVLPRRGLALK